jgi:hypothetical protein
VATAYFGLYNATTYDDWGSWQLAISGESNSPTPVDPLFKGSNNLHLQSTSPALGIGTPIAEVTNDFDGRTRPATPDIGADEREPNTPAAVGNVTYTVKQDGTGDFLSIREAAEHLTNNDLNGPVTIDVYEGEYAGCDNTSGGSMTFGAIGTSTNTILLRVVSNQRVFVTGYTRALTLNGTDYMTIEGGFEMRHISFDGFTAYLIYIGGTATNNRIEGNYLVTQGDTTYSVYIYSDNDNNTIVGNTLRSGYRTIQLLSNTDNTTISQNLIGGNDYGVGIALSGTSNTQITRNQILGNVTGIYLNANSSALVANNMITGITRIGIYLDNTTATGIYFNSLRITADNGVTSYCIRDNGGSNNEFRNNILYAISGADAGEEAYCYYDARTLGLPRPSDYNDYYTVSGGQSVYVYRENDGTLHATLESWQDDADSGTYDDNSISQDPGFVSSTDLHISSTTSPVINAGTASGVSGVTDDYDGQTRTGPDIGADERLYYDGYVLNSPGGSPVSGVTVRVLVNGVDKGSDVTDSNGYFLIEGAGHEEGDGVLFYVDAGGGDEATTVTRAGRANLTGIELYQPGTVNYLVIRDDSGQGITNQTMATAKGSYSDADIMYTTSGNDITVPYGFAYVANGCTFSITSGNSFTTQALFITSGTTLRLVDAAGLYINGSNEIDLYGTLEFSSSSAAGTLKFDMSSGIDVQDGGTLLLTGLSSTYRATLTYYSSYLDSTDQFVITVYSGGTIRAEHFKLDSGNIVIRDGARVTQFRDGVFDWTVADSGGIPVARGSSDYYLYLNVTGSNRHKLPPLIKGVRFDGSAGYNVKATPNTPTVCFVGTGDSGIDGALWGEDYDDDPYDRVVWVTGSFARVDSSGNPVEYYTSIEEALSDADVTDGTVIQSVKNIIVNESVDLAVSGKDVIIEGVVLQPKNGLAVYNSDNVARGILRNCIITAGGVDYVKRLYNCTLFRRNSQDFSALQVTNSTLVNCIVESGSTTTGSSFTNCITDATSELFGNPELCNFHLVSTATSAIDEGVDLSAIFTTDFEGHTRGYDGKSGGNAGNWDIGADEYMGTNSNIVTGGTHIGNISKIRIAGKRGTGNVYAYVITSGSAASSEYNNRLLVIDMANLSVVTDSGTPIGYSSTYPIRSIGYHTVSASPFDRRIYLSVDTDRNGEAERIVALRDTGGTLSTAIQLYSDFGGGTGYKDYGVGPIEKLITPLRPDAGKQNRLFFVTKTSLGASQLYKVNIDWTDVTADGDGVYGDTIWVNDLVAFEPHATMNYDPRNNYLFLGCSGDVSNYVIVKTLATGNTANPIATSWQAQAGEGNQNRYGQTVILGLIHCGPSSGSKVFSTTISSGDNERRWTSPALAGSIKGVSFRFANTTCLMIQAGTYVYKLKDSGAIPAQADDGSPVDPDWPRKIEGDVVSRITELWWRNIWCTTGGWVYCSYFNKIDNTTSGDEPWFTGFPFKFPGHRFKWFFITGYGSTKGMYFVTDQGGLLRAPIPQ